MAATSDTLTQNLTKNVGEFFANPLGFMADEFNKGVKRSWNLTRHLMGIDRAETGQTPRDAVWFSGKSVLYRYRSDDVAVRWPLSSPMRNWHGRREVAEGLASGRAPSETGLDPETFATEVHKLIVDGRVAALEITVTARTYDALDFRNLYVFIYEFDDDGLLVSLTEHGDTLNGAIQLPKFWAPALSMLENQFGEGST